MFAASKAFRSLKNVETGLDVSVPSVTEVEAPLGGTTVEYEILVLTNLPNFKSHYHKEEDVIRYSVQRAYREVEDFYDKIEKKFKGSSLPTIPKGRDALKYISEEKRAALDSFMQHISKNKDICQSELFLNFIGLNKLKMQKIPISSGALEITDSVCSKSAGDNSSTNSESCQPSDLYSSRGQPDLNDANISELFPKVKVRKASKPECIMNESKTNSDADSLLFSGGTKTHFPQDDDELDLFEEAKQVPKRVEKEEKLFNSDKNSQKGLFDDFSESEKLFSNLTVKNEDNVQRNSKHIEGENSGDKVFNLKLEQKNEEKNDFSLFDRDSSIGHKNLKSSKVYTGQLSGDDESLHEDEGEKRVHLFEEQDFGAAITEEDETLFFVAKPEEHPTTHNPFLSPTSDDTDDGIVVESLEDLMNLPDPSIALLNQKSPSCPPSEENDELLLPKKPPVPMPRKKPPVQAKPQVAPKPAIPVKPSLPPKPKIARKPSLKSGVESEQTDEKTEEVSPVVGPKEEEATTKSDKLVDELTSFDIMKYIEEEERAAVEGANLFD